MRKEFASWCELNLNENRHVFLTGDLGYMALENVKKQMGDRFINAGVSEQNMIGMAAGLASEDFIPLCYSITPFCVFRPAEQIRLDVCLHNLNVKIVGNGGGYGYGIMGASHHAIEDIGVLSTFQNMKCFIPFVNSEVEITCDKMYSYKGPSYLRLGHGVLKEEHYQRFSLQADKTPCRKLSEGKDLVIVFMGPVGVNVLDAILSLEAAHDIKGTFAIYLITEVPITLRQEFFDDIKKCGKLLIVEEHVARGGIGESISLEILKNGISVNLTHLSALGYPSGTYGAQAFHQKESKLDSKNIQNKIKEILN